MARIIVLDAGPLGLASKARGKPDADRCRVWILALGVAAARVVVPEIADYEVRRELILARKTTGLARLDRLEAGLTYDPITTAAMRRGRVLGVGPPGRTADGGPARTRRRLHPGGASLLARRPRGYRDDRDGERSPPQPDPESRRPV